MLKDYQQSVENSAMILRPEKPGFITNLHYIDKKTEAWIKGRVLRSQEQWPSEIAWLYLASWNNRSSSFSKWSAPVIIFLLNCSDFDLSLLWLTWHFRSRNKKKWVRYILS